MTAPELSRPIRIETIGSTAKSVTVTAEPAERAALAGRFGLIALARLEAGVRLADDGEAIRADGRLQAEAVQACVVTAAPVPVQIDEPFALRFLPERQIDRGDEAELSEADCDTLPHDGKTIELGEAIAETFALALDPYPRCPEAAAALREAGVIGEAEATTASSPFARLKKN